MTLRDRIRFAVGNRWAFSARRREDIKTALILLVILIAYGIAGEMDYRDELRQQAESAKAAESRVLRCLNGEPLGTYDRPKRDANDFGKVAVFCKTEEIDV